MLPATAAALAVLAALLAWPVPAGLGRARWPRRDPLVALVCWQAVGLAGGLSIVGALLVHGLAPWGHSLPEAGWAVLTGRSAADPVRGDHWVALTLAAVLTAELLGVLALSWARTARTRRRHRELLELVVQPSPAAPDARLLEHPAPVAFCIPGARPLLVLSSGMVAELDDDQLAAVVAHERAHLAEHHHLYLLPFVAWEAALPVLPAAARAHAAVRELVEMRADDRALTTLGGPAPRRTLAQAIVVAAGGAGGGVPDGALAVAGSAVGARVVRLVSPPPPLPPAARAAALLAAGLLLLVPTVLLLLPAF
ncbi:peptidase M48-like protein [Geodermatophilus tzadiensis]|uniref:Peptidase M48-like protein n=1 Tax=Geodermatophilus tzadiensis TaxID=1137988 RepID=A0A2T0TQE3_9ACTN|nr:M56 family metallopeptidase [Geodermatophilus tzadiensis]PRY47877.1 peptidase M48-like protein [Geodermatophilus tzadiensis]